MLRQQLPFQNGQAPPRTVETGNLQRYIANWLLDGKIRQLSPGTLSGRQLVCDKLVWFLEQEKLQECDTAALKQFFNYLGTGHDNVGGRWGNDANRKQPRPTTVQMYYGRLRTFFAYLVQEGILGVSPFARLRPPIVREDQIQPFTGAQVSALLHAATLSPCPKRNKAIVLMLLDTGVRATELCSLIMKNVDLVGQKATVLGKGNKKRTVYFGRIVLR